MGRECVAPLWGGDEDRSLNTHITEGAPSCKSRLFNFLGGPEMPLESFIQLQIAYVQ